MSVGVRLDGVDDDRGRPKGTDTLYGGAKQALGLWGSGRHNDDGRRRTNR